MGYLDEQQEPPWTTDGVTALPPDLREAEKTVRAIEALSERLDCILNAEPSTLAFSVPGDLIALAREVTLVLNEYKRQLALIGQRLMEYRTALEMIRDKRGEGGSKLISGREAEAIASAALSKEKP